MPIRPASSPGFCMCQSLLWPSLAQPTSHMALVHSHGSRCLAQPAPYQDPVLMYTNKCQHLIWSALPPVLVCARVRLCCGLVQPQPWFSCSPASYSLAREGSLVIYPEELSSLGASSSLLITAQHPGCPHCRVKHSESTNLSPESLLRAWDH